jgi:Tol biopolymer transport system component/ketosteroid isomerase-like protein
MPRVFCLAFFFAATAHAAYAQTFKVIYSETPPVWFEAHTISAVVAPSGTTALLPSRWPAGIRVIDIATGVARESPNFGLEQVRNAVFTHNGDFALWGRLGSQPYAWYVPRTSQPSPLSLPAGSGTPAWNAAGDVAYFLRARADSGVTVVTRTRTKRLDIPGTITAIAWLDSVNLLALASDARGASSLYSSNSTSAQRRLIARGLDADPLSSRIAVAHDRRHAYIALAGDTAAAPAARHDPFADRDLDIYEIDLRTGTRRPLIDTDADESAPFVAGEHLYWTSSRMQSAIVLVPSTGGSVRHIVPNAMHPSWHPNGRTLGLFYGAFRSADWVLNWDAGTFDVDTQVPAARITPLLTNFHEDFEPVWSPNGQWIAYHSHRAETPVLSYSAPGSTDDIWLLRAGSREQIRLTTNKWEVGSPDWSRDGTRLVYTGWDRQQPGRTYVSVIALDTTNGRVLSDKEIPLGEIPSAETAFWSPTSDEIAIEAVRAPGRRELWVVKPDGSGARKLADYSLHTYGGLSWTRDGSALIYPSIVDNRMQLFRVASAGGVPQQLTHDVADLLHPRVSPDGQSIAATRLLNTKQIRRVKLHGAWEMRAIDQRRAAFERAASFNGDLDAVVGSYTPDALLVSSSGELIRGSAAIRAYFRNSTRSLLEHDVLELDVRGDRAYEIGKWTRRGLDGVAQRSGWYAWTWRRQRAGTWAVERDVWSRTCGVQPAPACP